MTKPFKRANGSAKPIIISGGAWNRLVTLVEWLARLQVGGGLRMDSGPAGPVILGSPPMQLPRFGVAQSVVGNEVTLKPSARWDDPTSLITGAADVVCYIVWPFDATPPGIFRVELGKSYPYAPIPPKTGETINRGILWPVNIGAGC